MDLSTIIGIILGIALVASAILMGQSPMIFVNPPALMLVVGGTVGATLMRNPLSAVFGTIKVVSKAFLTKLRPPAELIEQVVGMSRKARKESLLSLEKVKIDYQYLAKGIQLCVDGLEPSQIRGIMETEIEATAARHKRGQDILEGIGAAAPAFGMIGTLIGLVQMLTSMDDPKAIGPAMAVAILTTLYGAMIANMIALPLADKLKVRSQEERLIMTLCLEGVLGVVQGEHPASIDEKLNAFIPARQRATKDAGQTKAA